MAAAASEPPNAHDVLIMYGKDAREWCQYLQSLFHSCRDLQTYLVESGTPIPPEKLELFKSSRCTIVLLSCDLVKTFQAPAVLKSLQEVLQPPHKIVKLFCGVAECEDYQECFEDWSRWKLLTYDDDPETYVAAVMKAISEGDSGCDSVTDADGEDVSDRRDSCNTSTQRQRGMSGTKMGNLIAVQPNRIRCGVRTTMYIILKCKLDSQVKIEVEFSSEHCQSVRVPSRLENEYTVSVCTPDLSPGTVCLRLYAGDLMVAEADISYYTDMEEISDLLTSAANPVEFMCQAFKVVPYNTEALDKILTESLKKNLPASGLHLLGINQLEEEDISTSQRDEELPTLLHFAAKYGLKNLTALLLTCPGALQAYSVANKYGLYPNNIAEKQGFKDLRQFIDEYVETADMLKSHIKEQLMEGKEDDSVYESMAYRSTDLLMKCSLNPACDEDLYESMAGLVPGATEDLYVEMLQSDTSSSRTTKDYMMRRFLEGVSMTVPEFKDNTYHLCEDEEVYHTVEQDNFPLELINRPPVPVPRPDPPRQQDKEPYIYKVFSGKDYESSGNLYVSSENLRKEAADKALRVRSQSSIYDPFAGMKTPGQRQLITLQEQVKLGMLTVDEAVLHFKEWQLNQKKRSDSFRFQQENLKKLRDSITRRQLEKQKAGKHSDLEITVPVGHSQNTPKKPECGIYEFSPRKNIFPPSKEIKRGDWKTESSSSSTSSSSNRSSTRSLLSVSSGMDGDNEDNEMPEVKRNFSPMTHQGNKPHFTTSGRTPRIPPRTASRPLSSDSIRPPPVPPRGREMLH
ncbi:phosphoinositide 3-kinase adapter protein 1 isoform X2 [Eublepharis macularius]|uniref:Phosphoinositide 3-kinase adapter protein 1 n=1 Tax=Eublepharis macularius TaxID=481883 RepID=A0AA97JLL8_EUBMA|nr:phosphoinositide 3-kinase adapter protein 1 isoform X2 [Eublepharis macularius]